MKRSILIFVIVYCLLIGGILAVRHIKGNSRGHDPSQQWINLCRGFSLAAAVAKGALQIVPPHRCLHPSGIAQRTLTANAQLDAGLTRHGRNLNVEWDVIKVIWRRVVSPSIHPIVLDVDSVSFSGVITDTYDFRYDAPTPADYGATIQAGYDGTIGRTSGKVFKYRLEFNNTASRPMFYVVP